MILVKFNNPELEYCRDIICIDSHIHLEIEAYGICDHEQALEYGYYILEKVESNY